MAKWIDKLLEVELDVSHKIPDFTDRVANEIYDRDDDVKNIVHIKLVEQSENYKKAKVIYRIYDIDKIEADVVYFIKLCVEYAVEETVERYLNYQYKYQRIGGIRLVGKESSIVMFKDGSLVGVVVKVRSNEMFKSIFEKNDIRDVCISIEKRVQAKFEYLKTFLVDCIFIDNGWVYVVFKYSVCGLETNTEDKLIDCVISIVESFGFHYKLKETKIDRITYLS